MNRLGGDDADYVLIYDGENGLRMAPRASAAAFEGQDPGHLEMAPTAAETAASSRGAGRAKIAAVIGAVAGLGLLGFLVGRGHPPGVSAPRPVAIAPATQTALTTHPTVSPAIQAHGAPAAQAKIRDVARSHVPPSRARVLQATANHRPAIRRRGACASARGWAELVVCRDPQLAAEDARLGRALTSAIQAGAPTADLQDGQTAWLAQRNLAARRSRSEVAAAYRQRIEEVESLANEAPPF